MHNNKHMICSIYLYKTSKPKSWVFWVSRIYFVSHEPGTGATWKIINKIWNNFFLTSWSQTYFVLLIVNTQQHKHDSFFWLSIHNNINMIRSVDKQYTITKHDLFCRFLQNIKTQILVFLGVSNLFCPTWASYWGNMKNHKQNLKQLFLTSEKLLSSQKKRITRPMLLFLACERNHKSLTCFITKTFLILHKKTEN